MFPGFLPFSRASGMMDLVACSMVFVIPILTYSIYLVRVKQAYEWHRRLQTWLVVALGLVVLLFEIDVRLYGWREAAMDSVYYGNTLNSVLGVHLFFAISTTLLWTYTFYKAVVFHRSGNLPGSQAQAHRKYAKISSIFMYCTALTGWTFYGMAFVF